MLQTLVGFDPALRRVRDAVGFIVVAGFLSTAISATIGVTTLCAAGVQPWVAVLRAVVGLVVGRCPRSTRRRPRDLDDRPHGGLVATNWDRNVFCWWWARRRRVRRSSVRCLATIGQHPLEYVIFPFVIAAAVRLGQPATALVVLGASVVTIWNTVRGAGPFAGARSIESLILLQAFMGVLAGTGLLLAAAIAERDERASSCGRVRGRRSPDGLARI